MYKPVFLVILDGWGISPHKDGNAIEQSEIPTISKLDKNYLTALGATIGFLVGIIGEKVV
jgi:bisphosphoglycerate-independent phosphoglycerate mutase (AlkP superfamily)